jgi:uncharacterized membrane protein YphA (DoxX/SURF4 family)
MSKYGPIVARLLFGLMLVVFGLNGFLRFLPQPPMAPQAGAFAGALFQTGYMFPLIKGVEVLVGVLLLTNRLVPLALALIAPNVVNIVLFHTFLDPHGIAPALLILAFELYLAWAYRASYRSMLKVHTPLAIEQPRTETATATASA